ncbi:hypothetical protein DYB28_007972 [Aphanomyces astaci]|uniref:Orc1-like AAA ATPase domain-containing protein n=1 Tax=Aphanomyces astaci TaxID=112090 RepID=A0A9X8DTW7_APHAT|nr:hypothetical protein DYB28_007972 [Aphanomyces astaci]
MYFVWANTKQDNETQATEHLSRDLPDDHLAKKGSSPLTTPPNNPSSLHDLFMDGEFISLHDVLDDVATAENERTRALDALSPRYRLKSLVGRDVHWQAAMAFVARSFAVGCGSVCVSGPRGTGKSALVALLEEQVAAECAGRGRQLRPRHVDMSASVPRTSSLFVELANEMTNVQYASDADAMSALEETCRDPSWLTYEHDSPPRSVYFLDCC